MRVRDFSQAAEASDAILLLAAPINPRFSRCAGTGTTRSFAAAFLSRLARLLALLPSLNCHDIVISRVKHS